MVAEVKVIAQAKDGTSKTFRYKPGEKHPADGNTVYKLVVDGNEKVPDGTKITRNGNDIHIEFPDGQSFDFTDWCGVDASKLIDLEGAQAFSDSVEYVATKEIESGVCSIARPDGGSAGALAQPGVGPVAPPPGGSGGFNPVWLAPLALLGLAGGGGGGGGGGSNPPPVDTPAPDAPAATLAPASDSGVAGDNITRETKPTISGSGATPGDTVTVIMPTGERITTTVAADGTWSVTPLTALSEGLNNISVTATDPAGNVSVPTTLALVIDTTAPSAPSIAPDMTDATDTGSSTSDDFTRNSRPSFTITAPASGETPLLFVDGVLVPSVFDSGTNTLTPIGSIPPGVHAITTGVQDAAGNTSGPSPVLNIIITPVAALDPASDSGVLGDSLTNDNTPSIQGFGTPGDTITVTFPGGEIKTVTIGNPDGSWQVTPSNPLPEGPNAITVVARDPAGNTTSSDTVNIIIDTTPASAPTITAIPENASGGAISAAEAADGTVVQVSIPVDAKAGDILMLNIGGEQVLYTIQAGDIGAVADVLVSAATLANLSDGTVAVSATIADAAGNVSSPSSVSSLTLDRSPPSAPSITTIPDNAGGGINGTEAADGVVVNVGLPGDAKAGDTLTVIVNGTPTSVVLTALDIGNGTAPVTIPVGSLPAADGTYPVTAQVTDAAGNAGTVSAPFDITLDRGLPAAPAGAPDMTDATDSGNSNTDNNTNDTTPDFVIAAPGAGETPSLYVDGVKVPATFDPLTNTLRPTSPIADGPHTITYSLTDAAGNESALSPALPVTIDTLPPSAPATVPDMADATDSGTSNSDDNTNDNTPSFSVAPPAAGETPSLYIDGVKVPATFNAGTNTLTPTDPIPDGAHSITTTATDAAGNESPQGPSLAINIDTTAPSAPSITTIPDNASGGINGTEAADGVVVNVGLPGDAKAGDTLTVIVNGTPTSVVLTALDIGNGTAPVSIPVGSLPAADGTYPVTAQVTDAAGNAGTVSAPFDITLDRGLPAAPTALDLFAASDSGLSSSDDNTSDNTPTISGAPVEPGATVTLYDSDGTTILGTTVADGSGNWSITPSTPLADGVHNFTLKQTDSSGNTSPVSAALAVTIDTTAPSAPAAPDMTTATDSGTNTGDDNTNDNTPSFSVAPPAAGETPSLYIDGVKVPATFNPGTNTLTPTDPIPDGAHSITTTVTDAAGNESPQGLSLAINIDTAAPSVPSITAAPENSAGGINGTEASDGTPIQVAIPADAKVGDTLTLNVGGQTVTYTITAPDIGSTANVPVSAPTLAALADGVIPVTATLTDAAGNSSAASTPFNFTLDRVAPTKPARPDMSDLTDTGPSNIDDVTGNNRPTFQITAPAAGETPSLYVDGVKVSATLSQNPFNSAIFYLTPVDPIADGIHDITYTFSDSAGNESLASDPLPVTVDTGTPSAPASALDLATSSDSGTIDNDNYTNENSPEFIVPAATGAPGDRVKLYVDGVVVGTGTVAGDGSFTVSPITAIPDGVHTIAYTFTDAAGNESSQSPGLSVTIDTTAVAAPTIFDIPENTLGGVTTAEQADGTLVQISIPADATPGDILTLVIGSGPTARTIVQTVAAGEPGTTISVLVTEPDLTALGSGTFNAVATLIDLAGNVSAPSAPFALTLSASASTAPTISSVPENAGGGINAIEASDGIVVNVDLTGVQSSAGTLNPVGGDTLRLTINATTIDVVLSAAQVLAGTAQVTIPNPSLPASDGTYAITAVVFDGAPGTGQGADNLPDPVSAPFNVTFDRSVTAATVTLDMTVATDTGISNTDNVTGNSTPDFVVPAGSGTAGDTVELLVDGVVVATGAVLFDGSFALTPGSAVTDGVHNATYRFTDPAGNVSAPSPVLTFTVDAIKPTTPLAAPDMTAATDTGTSNNDDLTRLAQPVFTIAAPGFGESIKIFVDGIQVPYGPIGGNNYQLTSPLPDGNHVITYTLTDEAGNESDPSPALSFVIDTTAPSAPAAAPDMTAATDSGSSNTDNDTSDSTPSFTIPAPAVGQTPSLYVDGVKVPATFDSLANTLSPTGPIADGPHTITSTVTDAAGNESAQGPALAIIIDSGTPAAPTALDLIAASDTGASNTDNVTGDATPTITGAPVEPGATVTLYDSDGATVLGTTVADGTGNWSIASAALADGVHNFTAKQTDAAGNQGPASTPLPVSIDTTDPTAPATPDMSTATDSGANNTDNNTNDTTPDFTVIVPASHTATLYVDGVAVPATLVGGVLTPTNPIAEGAHTITYTVTDPAGNESPQSPSLAISIDITAPTAPTVIAAPENSNGGISQSEAGDGTTIQVSIPADAKAGDVLTLTLNGAPAAQTVTYTVLAGDVGATANVPVAPGKLSALNDGDISVTATLTDAAGNTSIPSVPFDITLDRAAPSQIPPLPNLDSPSDSGSSNTDNITNDTTPSFSQPAGTAPADAARVAVFVDGSVAPILVSVGPDGSFSFNSGVLVDGNHTITMAYVDAAGNTGAQSAPLNFTIDTTAPSAPIAPDMTAATDSGANNTDNYTNDATPSFTVPAPTSGEKPQLYIDGVFVPSTFDSGTNTLTPTNPIGDGAHSVATTITDVAGNESAQSPSLAITIDTTAPSALSVSAVPENSNGGVNAAEASDGTTIQVAVPSNAKVGDVLTLTLGSGGSQQTVTYTVIAGDVGATANVPVSAGSLSPLPNGSVPVSATLTDAAGNTGAPSAPFSFLLDTVAPEKPTIASVPENGGGGINASEGSDGTTINITLPTGTRAGDTISLNVGGTPVTYVVTAGDELSGTSAVPVSAAALASAVAPRGEGVVNLTATVTDAAGNVGATSDSFPINVDLDGAGAPQITDVPDNTQGGISVAEAADGSIVNVDISGTGAKPGDVITLNWGGAPVSYTLTATDITNNNAPVPVSSATINTRGSGTFDLTLTLTDSAGNVSPPSTPFTVKVDIVPPFAPTITAIPENDNGGINASEASNGTPIEIGLAGTAAEAGDVMHLSWGSQTVAYTLTATDIANGTATVTVSAAIIASVGDGTIPVVVASITDIVGNGGPASTPFSVVVDTGKPAAPVITSIPESTGGIGKSEATDGTVANVSLPPGTVAGDTVALNFGGEIINYTVLAGDESSGSAPIFVSKAILETVAGGPTGTANNVPVTATVADQAGNVSDPSANFPVNIDFGGPAAPGALDLTAASDTGASNSDNITTDDTPTLTGAPVEAGAIVTLYDSDGTTVLGTTVADGSGNWSITPSVAMSPGVHNLTTKQTDTAGNQGGVSTQLTVTIDTSGPSFTDPAAVNEGFISLVLNSTTLSGSDNVTASGSLEVISAIFKSSSTFVAGDLSFGAPSGGAITMTRTGGVDKSGTVVVTVQMRDGAGNVTSQDVTLSVNSVNDVPAGTDKTITTNEDTPYTFTTADFGYTDPNDSPANSLQGVRVAAAPAAGALFIDANGDGVVNAGESVAGGATVAASDIVAAKLKFLGAANGNGTAYTNFTFQVQDNGGTATGGVDLDASANTITVNVNAVNDAPINTFPASPTNGGPGGSVVSLAGISVADADESGSVALYKIDRLQITAPDGSLNVAVAPGATVTGNNTAALTITGTQTAINATVASLVYTDNIASVGNVTLTFTSTDKSGLTDTDPIVLQFSSPIVGTVGADTQTGNNLDDTIVGGGGDDVISGASGNDLLIGDSGNVRDYSFEYRGSNGTALAAPDNGFFFAAGSIPGWSRTTNGIQLNPYDAVSATTNTPAAPNTAGAGNTVMDSVTNISGVSEITSTQVYLISGQQYTLQFDATQFDRGGNINAITFSLGGAALMATTDAVSGSLTKTTLNAASESFGNWVLYNKTFTATTTGLTTLSFFCIGDAYGTMIDAITIDQIAATDNDTLDGGIGNDRLYGGKGNDTLTGGTGSDVFIYSMRTGYNQGTDTISDFDHNTDVIRLIDMLDLVAPQTSSGSTTTGSTLTLADLTNLGLADQRITNYTEAGANATLTFAHGTGVTVQGLGSHGFLGASVSASLNNLLTAGVLQLTSDGLPTS